MVQPPEFNMAHPFHRFARQAIEDLNPGVLFQKRMPMDQVQLAIRIERQRDFRGVLLPLADLIVSGI